MNHFIIPRTRTPRPSAVEVITTAYLVAHGRAPRGCGTWAFGERATTPLSQAYWAPAFLSYGEAKRRAQAHFAARNVTRIYVQS
jgi:hypothetical protein